MTHASRDFSTELDLGGRSRTGCYSVESSLHLVQLLIIVLGRPIPVGVFLEIPSSRVLNAYVRGRSSYRVDVNPAGASMVGRVAEGFRCFSASLSRGTDSKIVEA